MFKNAYQSGLLSIFYSCGARPLELWDVEVKNGHIKRITDNEVRSIVLEIGGSNVSTTYITCPKGNKSLGITLPYMVMIVKSLKKHFTFEVTILDQSGTKRRFRISNFQSTTQILPLCTTMPITLSDGWNQIQFNLAEFTKRSYKTQFMEVQKLKINANIRLRRVYFTEVLLPDDQLPPEYKLYVPLSTKKKLIKPEVVKGKENAEPFPSKEIVKQKLVERKDSELNVATESSKTSLGSVKKISHSQSKIKTEEKLAPIDTASTAENQTADIENTTDTNELQINDIIPIEQESGDGETINLAMIESTTADTEPYNTLPVDTTTQELPRTGSNDCGANPLALWDMEVKNGHIKRITDSEVNSIVLEIVSTNVATTFITCPRNNQCLGIKLPFLVMIVKNLKRYFSFEITILDDKNLRRRFRISNFQSTTKIKPFCTSMPIGLSGGWNQIQFNLSDFTRRAYGTQFIETLRVQIHANVRLRRIYFAEHLYTEEELPQEYKLYLPLERKQKKEKAKKEALASVKPLKATPIPPPPQPATEAAVEAPLQDEVKSTPVTADADKPSEEPPSAPESTPADTPADTPFETPREEVKEDIAGEEDVGPEAPSELTEEKAEPLEEVPEE